MKSSQVTLLGFPVTINNEPTDLAEAIEACGGGAVGEQKLTNKFVGYSNAHTTYGDGRSLVVEKVEEATGIKPLTSTDADEKDSIYIARALKESGLSIADIIAKVGPFEVDFNAGGARRSGTPKEASKTYLEAATNFLASADAEKIAHAVAGFSAANPTFTGLVNDPDGKPTAASLALLLMANAKRIRDEAAAAQAALGIPMK